MSVTSLTAATLIFVNLWLIAVTAFGVAAIAILLYILGAVDETIEVPVVVSLFSAAASYIYLILRCSNVGDLKSGQRWLTKSQRYIGKTCVQLPWILIICWIATTIIGFTTARPQPLCKTGDFKADAAAWQAGLGCWMLRVLVSLNVVNFILSFILFGLLEANGRHIPIALFHFESTNLSGPHHRRRSTIVASTYDPNFQSVETPKSPVILLDNHDARKRQSRSPKRQGRTTISPSPSYRTFNSTLSNLGLWPTLYPSQMRPTPAFRPRTKTLTVLDEESTFDSTSSRRTTATTATMSTVPLSHLQLPTILAPAYSSTHPRSQFCQTATNPNLNRMPSIHISSKFQSRPLCASALTSLPLLQTQSLPSNNDTLSLHEQLQAHLRELRDLENSCAELAHRADTNKNITLNIGQPMRTALYNITNTNMGWSNGSPGLLLTSPSSTALATAASATTAGPGSTTSKPLPTAGISSTTAEPIANSTIRPISSIESGVTEELGQEQPPPSWYPTPLHQAPLSSEPAIKRLAEFDLRRASTRVSRRVNLSGFEFGFGGRGARNTNREGQGGETRSAEPSPTKIRFGVDVTTCVKEAGGDDQKDVTMSATGNNERSGEGGQGNKRETPAQTMLKRGIFCNRSRHGINVSGELKRSVTARSARSIRSTNRNLPPPAVPERSFGHGRKESSDWTRGRVLLGGGNGRCCLGDR